MKRKFLVKTISLACASLLLSSVFFSCNQADKSYKHKKRVVKNKIVERGKTTRYNIAFTNGESDYFSFGLYSKYEIGDTICFESLDDIMGFWYVIDCR